MKYKDHDPVVIDAFNGLYQRGDPDNTPLDHFQDSNNIRHIGDSSFGTRDGIGISQDVDVPLENIKRIYNYPTQTGNTLIVLTYDYNTNEGSIYHVVDGTTVFGPLLTIEGMTDFAFIPYAGRAFISPFSSQPPVLLAPGGSITALPNGVGGSIESGVRQYAATFVNAAGETVSSPLATAEANNTLANPTDTPVAFQTGIVSPENLQLTPGLTYFWKCTFTENPGSTFETLPSPSTSTSPVNISNITLKVVFASGTPTGKYINIYRTVGGGSTYFLEYSTAVTDDFATYPVGLINDTELATHRVAPSSNTSQVTEIQLSNIPISGDSTVTTRKIYRTTTGGTQLKLLTTIADNVTTSFLDTLSDTTLGVNIPTINTAVIAGISVEKGLQGEFLYIYAGDGTPARKAAGSGITGTLTIANGNSGNTDPGFHLFGIVTETSSGYLSPPSAITGFTTVAGSSVSFGNIPTSGDPNVVKRHLVATIVIQNYDGNTEGYDFFFVPNATINNNTDTFLNNISFFDADLLDDASHLFDNFTEIPAGAVLSLYHNRLCLFATYTDISIGLISYPGEPEAISQIDGLIIFPLDGNPITNGQELRDILYVFKRSKTISFTDNGDVPSSWPLILVDNALGTSVHGIATVLDSGSSSVDFLIICTYQGVSLFNGRYITPELSLKIESFWRALDRTAFHFIQIVNAPIQKEIYIILPIKQLLSGNYSLGMDPKKIRWESWSYLMTVNTVAIVNIDEIVLGADLVS